LWGRLRISGSTVGMPIHFPLVCQRDIFHRKPVRGRAKLPSLPTFRHDDGIAKSCVSSLSSSYERIQCEKISRTYRMSRNKLHLLPDGETITPGQLVDNTGHTVNRRYLPIFSVPHPIGIPFCFKLEGISRSLVALGHIGHHCLWAEDGYLRHSLVNFGAIENEAASNRQTDAAVSHQ
jgi:hypothetical protein